MVVLLPGALLLGASAPPAKEPCDDLSMLACAVLGLLRLEKVSPALRLVSDGFSTSSGGVAISSTPSSDAAALELISDEEPLLVTVLR